MKNSLIKGFTFLALGSLIAKLFGGIYKILLTNVLGGQNIGVYQQLLPVYAFVVVLVSAGVPLGVSKMIANIEENKKMVALKATFVLFFVYSTILATLLALLSKNIAKGQGNESFWFVYCILSPAVVLSSLSAVLKGYFQSLQNFKPTAISNILEQISKIVFSIGLIVVFVSSSYGQITVAITGILVGELFGFVALIYMQKQLHKHNKNNSTTNQCVTTKLDFGEFVIFAKQAVKNVLPIMLTGLVLPFSNLIDSFLVVRLLNKNFDIGESIYLYGLQTGVVGAIINVPTTITFVFISVLMPSLSKNFASGDENKFAYKFRLAFKSILTITIPCFLFLLVYPNSIINLIYGKNLSAYNMNGQMISSTLLLWSSFNVVFSCLATFFSMSLQARDNRVMPIVNSVIGAVIKLILETIFVPATNISILAFTIAGVIGNLTILALNYYLLKRENVSFIKTIELLKIILCSTIVLAVSMLLATIGLNNTSFVLIGLFSVVMYLILCWKLKIFSSKELQYLTKSKSNT